MPGKFYVPCSIILLLLVFMGIACGPKKPDLIMKSTKISGYNKVWLFFLKCDMIMIADDVVI